MLRIGTFTPPAIWREISFRTWSRHWSFYRWISSEGWSGSCFGLHRECYKEGNCGLTLLLKIIGLRNCYSSGACLTILFQSPPCRMKTLTDTTRMSSLSAQMWHPKTWKYLKNQWTWYSPIGYWCIFQIKRSVILGSVAASIKAGCLLEWLLLKPVVTV